MKIRRMSSAFLFCICAVLCRAQATKTDQALLTQVREKYDAPFNRNVQSFDCAVDFSWRNHIDDPTPTAANVPAIGGTWEIEHETQKVKRLGDLLCVNTALRSPHRFSA